MAKQKIDTSKSENKFRYLSFKDKINDLKIEPFKDLKKKHFNITDKSHLYETFQYWSDINLSGNYDSFQRETEQYIKNLPTILYNKEKILNNLIRYIDLHDELSLQPLCELLSQLVHDLNEDFLPFYLESLNCLISLTKDSIVRQKVKAFEYGFNSLIYIFKYLSKQIIKHDESSLLIETFNVFNNLITDNANFYIKKFSAESLSFLLRKCNKDLLRKIIDLLYEKMESTDYASNNYEGIFLIISEALKISEGSLHSKFEIVISILLDKTVIIENLSKEKTINKLHKDFIGSKEYSELYSEETLDINSSTYYTKKTSLFTDILLDSLRHVSTENSEEVYSFIVSKINNIIQNKDTVFDLEAINKVLTTLCFAESGYKVSNWGSLTKLMKKTISLYQQNVPNCYKDCVNGKTYTMLFIVFIRNCSEEKLLTIDELNKQIISFIEKYFPSEFLPFVDNWLNSNAQIKDKFSSNDYSEIILNNIISIMESNPFDHRLSTFILRNSFKHIESVDNFLNLNFKEEVLNSYFQKDIDFVVNSNDDLFNFLTIVDFLFKNCKDMNTLLKNDSSMIVDKLIKLFQTVLKKVDSNDDKYVDCLGKFLSLFNFSGSKMTELYEILSASKILKFESFFINVLFVKGLKHFLISTANKNYSGIKNTIVDEFAKPESVYLELLCDNLLLPNRNIRVESFFLIQSLSLMSEGNLKVHEALNTLCLIEDIPHDLNSARDIQMRLRNMVVQYNEGQTDSFSNKVCFNYMFGLMTIRFSPIFDTIIDCLGKLYHKDEKMVFDLCMRFLTAAEDLNEKLKFIYNYENYSSLGKVEWWYVKTSRFNDMIKRFNNLSEGYNVNNNNYNTTFVINMKIGDAMVKAIEYPLMLRQQILKALNTFPHLAERFYKQLVPFFLRDDEETDLEVYGEDKKQLREEIEAASKYTKKWSDSDKNLLLKLFGQFTNMVSFQNQDLIYDRLLTLLTNRSTEVQKLALTGIFGYKNKKINKYKDNLNNLLNDVLFKDEIAKILSDDDDKKILEDADKETVIPLVLRIMFGRVQTPNTNGLKKSRKGSVISYLPNFAEDDIIMFLSIGSHRLKYDYFIENGCVLDNEKISPNLLRRISGFLNVVNSLFSSLGSKFPRAIESLINPLIYCCAVSYRVVELGITDDNIDKSAGNVRQQSLKAFNNIFEYYGGDIEWLPYFENFQNVVIKPRLEKFDDENLQQPSSILKIIAYWSNDVKLYNFLYYNNFANVQALMLTLINDNVKEGVVGVILKFVKNLIEKVDDTELYAEMVALVVSNSLSKLPLLFTLDMSPETSNIAVELLLNIEKLGFIENNETKLLIINSLTNALDFNTKKISQNNISKVLVILSSIIENFTDLNFEMIKGLYKQLSVLLRYSVDKEIRMSLNDCFLKIGEKITDLKEVCQIISDVNSFALSRQSSYDFDKRLEGFRKIFDEDRFMSFTESEWLPLIQTCLYFINDPEEYVMRTNGKKVINSYTDYLNRQEENLDALDIMKDIILPNLQKGLRKKNDEIKNEYIDILAYIVSKSTTFKGLSDMRVLVNEADSEADFFNNINHIQLHRRSRAMRRLTNEICSQLQDNSVAHYLIPMFENYVFIEEEKYRTLCNDSIQAIGILSNYLSWHQYKALFRRYKGMIKNDFKNLKELITLLVRLSNSFRQSMLSVRGENSDLPSFTKLPKNLSDPEKFIKGEIYPEFTKILNHRDDETIVARIPLSEVLVNCILGLDAKDISSYLPGSLTSVCQVLRSKAEELRDAVRKNLSKICLILGTDYLQFIFKELKGALTRGSQIHVLSFTVHHVLTVMDSSLKVGDLDSSIKILMDVIMEDTFGTAGQEKDADGYQSKTKEVKHNKSFDTAEIVSSYIGIKYFSMVLKPIKAMLLERLPNKVQNKLKEMIRRISLGITKNPESSTTNFLKLCHEIYTESLDDSVFQRRKKKVLTEQEEHFIVNLNAKSTHVEVENTLYTSFLQKISIDFLRSAIVKNENLMKVEYLESFIPILKKLLFADDEMVVISTLRVLIIFSKLEFSKDSEPIFKNCCRKAFNIIKDSPSTASDICQFSLKFLSVILRNKPNVEIKNSALSFILTKLLPDFNEPTRQGLAFNFLKSLVMKHCMIPELYDIVDSISITMVANHSKEIRDVSRSVYYQFLVEYDHSNSLLEKKFKFLINNLQYPSPDGRLSVLELVQMIIKKSSPELMLKLSSSLFVALANVACNDDNVHCKEVAFDLLGKLLKRLTSENTATIENYILTWMKQSNNELFTNLGLRMYKVFVLNVGFNINKELDELALSLMKKIMIESKKQYDKLEDFEDDEEVSWQLLYTVMNLMISMLTESDGKIEITSLYDEDFAYIWRECIPTMILYPHPWIRLYASKLSMIAIEHSETLDLTNYSIQTISFKLFRQLSAPYISEELAQTSLKLLVKIIMKWNKTNQMYIQPDDVSEEEKSKSLKNVEENEGQEGQDLSTTTTKFKTWLDFVISKATYMLRNENLTAKESHVGKRTMIQLLALISQILSAEQLNENEDIVPKIIMPLYVIMEKDGYHLHEDEDLKNLEEIQSAAKECMQILEDKLGVNEYSVYYAKVNKTIVERRQERKAKRSRLEITNPQLASTKKLKKHKKSNENRKLVKNSSGYYSRNRS